MESPMPSWYTEIIHSEVNLQRYLETASLTGKVGTLALEDGVFRRIVFDALDRMKIVVDGSNVAWGGGSRVEGDIPKTENLELVLQALEKKGFDKIITVVDASLKHEIDDKRLFQSLKKRYGIVESPAGTDADQFIIEHVINNKCFLISNDTFRDWKDRDSWIAENIDKHRMSFIILDGSVQFSGDFEAK